MSKPDNNYPPGDFAGRRGEVFADLTLEPPSHGEGFDDLLKVSGCTQCRWENFDVIGGAQRENAIDLNNHSTLNTFYRGRLFAGGQGAILIKGGSFGNVFTDIEIVHAGGHSDVFVGDYSDQSRARSDYNQFYNVRRTDGEAVRVSWNFFRTKKPKFFDSNVRYQWALSFVRTLYVEAKYLLPSLIP